MFSFGRNYFSGYIKGSYLGHVWQIRLFLNIQALDILKMDEDAFENSYFWLTNIQWYDVMKHEKQNT